MTFREKLKNNAQKGEKIVLNHHEFTVLAQKDDWFTINTITKDNGEKVVNMIKDIAKELNQKGVKKLSISMDNCIDDLEDFEPKEILKKKVMFEFKLPRDGQD